MKFLYYVLAFIAMNLAANVQAQHQHVIPILTSSSINNAPTQTTQQSHVGTSKKRKFTQKTSIKRHSKIKKVCLYTGLAVGIIVGFCLGELTMPIMIAIFKGIGYAVEAIACLLTTGKIS